MSSDEHAPVLSWRNGTTGKFHASNKCKCGELWPHEITELNKIEWAVSADGLTEKGIRHVRNEDNSITIEYYVRGRQNHISDSQHSVRASTAIHEISGEYVEQKLCGAPGYRDNWTCEKPAGHTTSHGVLNEDQSGWYDWPNVDNKN